MLIIINTKNRFETTQRGVQVEEVESALLKILGGFHQRGASMIREAAAIVKKETQQRLYFLRILKKVHLLLEQLLSNNYHWTPSLFYCILLIRVYQSKLNAADCTRKQQNISNELQKLQTEVFFKYFYSKYCKTTQMYLKWAIKGSNSCIPHFCRNLEYFRSEL